MHMLMQFSHLKKKKGKKNPNKINLEETSFLEDRRWEVIEWKEKS